MPKILLGAILGGGLLALATSSYSDCTECVQCSADPVFIQRDYRNPLMIPLVRRLASKRLQDEGLQAVVVLSDDERLLSGDALATRTIVLISSEGTTEAREFKGELPPEVRPLIGFDQTQASSIDQGRCAGPVLVQIPQPLAKGDGE